MQNKDDVYKHLWSELFKDTINKAAFQKELPPYLVHYTSVPVLESIVKNDELWFSHPLLMNDIQELRLGLDEGTQMFLTSKKVFDACKSPLHYESLTNFYRHYLYEYNVKRSLDIYIFCVSAHATGDDDGALSMWRGYGGNGSGVAIVFDTEKIGETPNSCIRYDKVYYPTESQRKDWLNNIIDQFTLLLYQIDLPPEEMYIPAHVIFERIRIFSIFTKHPAFKEENEWRFVYLKERDEKNYFETMLSYSLGPKGLEPKLKFKVTHHPDHTPEDMSLDNIIHRIILGPTMTSPLVKNAFTRMLVQLGKPSLAQKIVASSIPFRG